MEGEGDTGRRVSLVLSERVKVLAQQLLGLVQARQPVGLPLHTINYVYLRQFGVALNPATYQCQTVAELLAKLPALQVCSRRPWVPLVAAIGFICAEFIPRKSK